MHAYPIHIVSPSVHVLYAVTAAGKIVENLRYFPVGMDSSRDISARIPALDYKWSKIYTKQIRLLVLIHTVMPAENHGHKATFSNR